MIDINKVVIKKFIGSGWNAIVYLVEYENKQYALKINLTDNKYYNIDKFMLDNEIKFQEEVVNKYPQQFCKLYSHDIVDKCYDKKYIKDIHNYVNNENAKFRLLKLSKGGSCFKRLYELLDGTLNNNIILTLSTEQKYSALIQYAYIIHILEKNNYVQNDINLGNLAFKKIEEETIKIKDYDIPTFGFRYYLIDYEHLRKKNDMTENPFCGFIIPLPCDKVYGNEFMFIFIMGFLMSDIQYKINEYEEKNNMKKTKLIRIYDDNIINTFKKMKVYKKLQKINVPEEILIFIFAYLYPKKYIKLIFDKDNYDKFINIYKDDFVNYIMPKFTCREIKKIAKYKNKIRKLIQFFLHLCTFKTPSNIKKSIIE